MKNCRNCNWPISEIEPEPKAKLDLHWSRETDTGKPSTAYDELVNAVRRIIVANGNILVNGGAGVVAERIVYELVDILGMMPNEAARKYVERLKVEILQGNGLSDFGNAASAG